MQVEVDVYSGRPNPRWDLSPHQAEEFRRLIGALPGSESGGAPADNLGYRGLIVRGGEPGAAGDEEFVIGGGMVWARGSRGGARQLADANRAVERWVLRTGAGLLEGELYEYLSAEVGRD